jgi:hypothetical protein
MPAGAACRGAAGGSACTRLRASRIRAARERDRLSLGSSLLACAAADSATRPTRSRRSINGSGWRRTSACSSSYWASHRDREREAPNAALLKGVFHWSGELAVQLKTAHGARLTEVLLKADRGHAPLTPARFSQRRTFMWTQRLDPQATFSRRVNLTTAREDTPDQIDSWNGGTHLFGGGPQRAVTLAGTFMANTKRWPSWLIFLQCCGCCGCTMNNGPGNVKRSLGVPA